MKLNNFFFYFLKLEFLIVALNQKFGGKIPGGLVTKNAAPGYEMVRLPGPQTGTPNFMGQNQLNQLGQLPQGGGPYGGFPSGLPNMSGFNPAAFLQQCKYL